MTETEICKSYRNAANRTEQIEILSQLCATNATDIMVMLVKNGEVLPEKMIKRLYRRMDALEEQIKQKETEYQNIAKVFKTSRIRRV